MDLAIGFLLLSSLLAVCFGVLQIRRMRELKRQLQKSEENVASLRHAHANLRQECEALQQAYSDVRGEFAALRDTPPMPADSQLADYLDRLSHRLVLQAEGFEQSRIKSVVPMLRIAEMAAASRVATRKPRLAQLQVDIESANTELAGLIDRHVTLLSSLAKISDALSREGFSENAGHGACEEVARCILSIDREAREEADHGGILHQPTEEFRMRLSLYDRAKELARSEREEQRRIADIAFSRHKLPPLTPFEKFRSLKSFGQSDSLT
jgi:hypothetical protein